MPLASYYYCFQLFSYYLFSIKRLKWQKYLGNKWLVEVQVPLKPNFIINLKILLKFIISQISLQPASTRWLTQKWLGCWPTKVNCPNKRQMLCKDESRGDMESLLQVLFELANFSQPDNEVTTMKWVEVPYKTAQRRLKTIAKIQKWSVKLYEWQKASSLNLP